jgi:hypothetical protein
VLRSGSLSCAAMNDVHAPEVRKRPGPIEVDASILEGIPDLDAPGSLPRFAAGIGSGPVEAMGSADGVTR